MPTRSKNASTGCSPIVRPKRRCIRGRRGAVLVLVVILLPVVLLLSAFAINVAYMELNKTEMYVAADAAARAGGREFATTRNQGAAIVKAKEFANLNEVAGKPLQLANSDLVFGTSVRIGSGRYNFVAGGLTPNALAVTANRKNGSLDGSIPLLMPNLFGISSVEYEQQAISTQVEVDIALVIDRSGSMAYAAGEIAAYPPAPYSAPAGWQFCDPAPPDCRWRNVVDGVSVFLDQVQVSPSSEQVSLSTYSDWAITDRDLTDNYNWIKIGLLPYTDQFCAGGTNIGGGINEGLGALKYSPTARPGAAKVIIVLTDGIHNVGSDPYGAAAAAADEGAQIFTITFSDEANQASMQSVALTGGGKHFHANSPFELVNVFREIAMRLPTLLTQ